MKKIAFIAIMILMQYFVLGQSIQRSQSNLPILSDDKAQIDKPMGWVLQDNGLWRFALGKILLFDSESNRKPDQIQKLGRTNINKAVLKEVLVGDDQYAILIVFSSGGYYEFPDMRQGFHKTKIVDYYVFNSRKLDEILPLDIKYNEAYAVNLEVFAYDHLVDIDKKDIDTKISYNILRTLRQQIKSQFTSILNVMPIITNGKKFFRFRLVKILNKKSLYQKYLLDENKDKLFTRSYFEVPYKDFVDFFSSINIIKPDFNVENPVNFADFYKRGVMRYDRGHYERALSDFNAAIQLEPENRFMMLYAYLGSTQHELENYPAAIRAFDKAILFEPSDPSQKLAWVRVYYNRGVSKYKMEDKMNACKDMNRAKMLGLKDEEALKNIKKSCKGKYKDVIAK
jgi:tetratricopeptide (TPR) repeat protein